MESSQQYLEKFGQNLARIRKQNGMSQRDIEDYGITRSYYGKVELGRHAITVDKLFLLSRAFGMAVDQLFMDEDGRPL